VKVVQTVGALILGFLLTILSLPWICWAVGRAFCGDWPGFDRAMDASPMVRWFD
jgi:hypothetical protein